ncbi:TPA: hypothetical protein PXM37_004125 [Yersinia enterocolitica]|nr:hypothetical protein [Yersinia enterocolitica]HDL6985186.1 hypothetical protein [Yersinia enterocolitica]HDL7067728.1 hypothetical protein [Yersinia enterocolitica]HDL7072116.1 hypothetical protein [Yersinia enterocolitica]
MSALLSKAEKAKAMAYQIEVLMRASDMPDSPEDGAELTNLAFYKAIELRKYLEDLMIEIRLEGK